ncbi:hypothetical protein RAA17_18540 [Komagataeibacter rhaeticus]|nr:hypothetical protein [Komagataeibacter rhaeticus]
MAQRRGDIPAARRWLEQAHALAPDDAGIRNALAGLDAPAATCSLRACGRWWPAISMTRRRPCCPPWKRTTAGLPIPSGCAPSSRMHATNCPARKPHGAQCCGLCPVTCPPPPPCPTF